MYEQSKTRREKQRKVGCHPFQRWKLQGEHPNQDRKSDSNNDWAEQQQPTGYHQVQAVQLP